MDLPYQITKTVTTASESGCVRLFHGTLASHVGSLVKGIDFTKGGGYFWVHPHVWGAREYADLAAQQAMFTGVPLCGQAILSFDIAITVLDTFKDQEPEPWLVMYAQGYRFSQACSEYLHYEMKNVEITFEE